jgi:hypothetical protein
MLVTKATATAQASVTMTARTMRRVLFVRGCWKTVRTLRKFKIQNSKFKHEMRATVGVCIWHFEL